MKYVLHDVEIQQARHLLSPPIADLAERTQCAPGDRQGVEGEKLRGPAGESPVRERGSACPVTSVASWKVATIGEAYTVIVWGVGLSHEILEIAGAEAGATAEGNMCGAVMRGTVALPGSEATSRMEGSRRNLGDLVWPAVACRSRAATGSRGDEAVEEQTRSRTAA
jgi:hypothetical protein